ncbi:hypothetical protein K458DRAFT_428553 [Lentithecium fluviatile CBS 122367]|uniref:Uncharacterized protein n=1 Tax=Lentithecium fluviatile CBS 122367 TaxID=1168545 RepID=A0A6G1JBW8_9PLEO|nr:hypothetical protein K458DRAFT_428553 [Lentithecium fluviatile CBS 122367]
MSNPAYLIIENDVDREFLFRITSHPNAVQKLRGLELHLDAELDAHQEVVLTAALTALHPLPNRTNFHNLEALTIIVHGNTLFTRYRYQLKSESAAINLPPLNSGTLFSGNNPNFAVKIHSTEKEIARALLGILGVPRVSISGEGKLEGGFKATLNRFLRLPPGATTVKISSRTMGGHYSTPNLDKVGELPSYGADPYVTYGTNIKPKMGSPKHRVLIDETIILLGHLTDANEEEMKRKAAAAASKADRSDERIWDEESKAFDNELPTTGRRNRRGGKHILATAAGSVRSQPDNYQPSPDPISSGLTFQHIVQIRADKQTSKLSSDEERFVEMGWKFETYARRDTFAVPFES